MSFLGTKMKEDKDIQTGDLVLTNGSDSPLNVPVL